MLSLDDTSSDSGLFRLDLSVGSFDSFIVPCPSFHAVSFLFGSVPSSSACQETSVIVASTIASYSSE